MTPSVPAADSKKNAGLIDVGFRALTEIAIHEIPEGDLVASANSGTDTRVIARSVTPAQISAEYINFGNVAPNTAVHGKVVSISDWCRSRLPATVPGGSVLALQVEFGPATYLVVGTQDRVVANLAVQARV